MSKGMLIFILSRVLDIVSTLINTHKWGIGVEGNPFVLEIMEKGLFIPYQFLMISVVIVIAEVFPRYKQIIYTVMATLNLLVFFNNLGCYLFIR